NTQAIAGFYTSIYGSYSSYDFKRVEAYLQKWSEIDFCTLDREFYGPRMTPPEGPRSFLYERAGSSDDECLEQCIEFDIDAEQPGSPRSTFDRDERIAEILSQGRRGLPTPPEIYDNSVVAEPNDVIPLMRDREEQRLRHEAVDLTRITWEADDYVEDEERNSVIPNQESSNIDANDSDTERWIGFDDAYITIDESWW
ncbi:MAG: hypothetical protein Q9214_003415, partial [Letrouitia sp. 1 TL-2023]